MLYSFKANFDIIVFDKAYAFFHFCTLSFARDTPILLRDTDFDVFFRVTARWVK